MVSYILIEVQYVGTERGIAIHYSEYPTETRAACNHAGRPVYCWLHRSWQCYFSPPAIVTDRSGGSTWAIRKTNIIFRVVSIGAFYWAAIYDVFIKLCAGLYTKFPKLLFLATLLKSPCSCDSKTVFKLPK